MEADRDTARTSAPPALFDIRDMVAIVTGGTGVLGSVIARGLAEAGARVGVLGRREKRAAEIAEAITDTGGEAMPLRADVLKKHELQAVRDTVLERWRRIDILVNAAGGNLPEATVGESLRFFDLTIDGLRNVVDLNLMGTILPCQVFGEAMAASSERGGAIVTISSMAAHRALTRVVAYGAAKAGVESFTRWLAAELGRSYGAGLRVNAIAPGFFIGEQNRDLLLKPDGSLTDRGRTILEHTPAGRFGEPEELIASVIWLCSPGASFVNGVVVPVDGGFSAFSGV